MTHIPCLSNDCAFPARESSVEFGLTKREYFAAIALQGLLAKEGFLEWGNAANMAVGLADSLIERLNENEHS